MKRRMEKKLLAPGFREMADSGVGSSEHLERLHEIFRGLHGELQSAPERLRGSLAVGTWEDSALVLRLGGSVFPGLASVSP